MNLTREIQELENALLKLESLHASFDYLQIKIASPKRIKAWAERCLPNGEIIGEILRPETINFRTHQPEIYGLFCEKVFGPIKNWRCRCGKYNGFALDKVCEECGVEIVESRVRRYRMGYIELTSPVAHLWYLKGIPNYFTTILKCLDEDLTTSKLEKIIYFKENIPHQNQLEETFQIDNFVPPQLNVNELAPFFAHEKKSEKENNTIFYSGAKNLLAKKELKGAEALKTALEHLNLKAEIKKARSFIDTVFLDDLKQEPVLIRSLVRRIRILESFLATNTNPSWMVLTTLPVLPPTLRPLVELENGRLVAADVNEIYRLIITRNQRLADFLYKYDAPGLITIQGKKLLQESVDSLIDNARLPKNKMFCLNNKPLKSLTEILEGKQGRFRQSLLGKRVDYSGRSVIIVGPTLSLNEVGLPYEMAAELFQPFLINELLKTKPGCVKFSAKQAQTIVKKNKPLVWSLLGKLAKKYCVLLNRAPTLHRYGIQAFDPTIVLGKSIHLHPLVCSGFNADFDGDQMAVHLPLYESSQLEARSMMRPVHNIFSSSNGEIILKPAQDVVIGCYYLTLMVKNNTFQLKKWFSNEVDALSAYYQKKLSIHTPILVRYSISCAKAKIVEKQLIFLNNSSNLLNKSVFIYQAFKPLGTTNKCYFICNIGVLIGYLEKENNIDVYKVTDLLLETTPGRLIFNNNFKMLKK